VEQNGRQQNGADCQKDGTVGDEVHIIAETRTGGSWVLYQSMADGLFV